VRDDEIQFVFTGLGQDLGERLVREVLEFVHIEIEVRRLRELMRRKVGAAHGAEEDARREHGAEELHVRRPPALSKD
jgi:hypothetical protein